ncbi:OmpH family outer membrane protein [Amylibacter sp. SFDW26]|uniref:OmpH family outer membrane protein n=1 Tax=Amylibacter sp. SFDW26 TaxID=2652722 RepID=UPI0012629EDB|nr:OmpH family outer membrane protein [Amylibacter sp. SFDW26]KAB7615883.1 OmpH family outer membrane protein [Amylibacter sp. SFDW26]
MQKYSIIFVFFAALIFGQTPYRAFAQSFPTSEELSNVATIDQERLFNGSAYGQSFTAKLQKDTNALADENRRIEQELVSEENDLTQKRKELSNVEFRKLASTFNEKVEKIRAEQALKTNELNATLIQARRAFFKLAQPIIIDLMQERGIKFILNNQAIFISTSDGDITDEAIERINTSLSSSPASQE